jgi:HEPN domain-containing protein
MTKKQHIDYWANTAHYDWTGAEEAFNAMRYVHCLFWAHLTLEKLAKAHWVRTNQDNIPPKIHNIVRLLELSNINLGEETMKFLEMLNRFQLSARYPDYINDMYKICTKDYTEKQLEKVKEVRQCLIEMLQSV